MKKMSGVFIPMVTPFTDADAIDIPSLHRLVDYLIDGGMDGLYPCGSMGEMMYMTVAERKLVAEETVKHVAGRVPVFVMVGANTLRDTIELAQHAAAIGADGVGVVTPSYYKLTDRSLVEFFTSVAHSVPEDFSVYLYGIPQSAVNDITPEVAAHVAAASKNVVGIKYSYPDFNRMQEFITINGGTFSVLSGVEPMFQAFCQVGGQGVIAGNAQVVPEHYRQLWAAIRGGDVALATKLQRRTNLLNAVLSGPSAIAHIKASLKREGVFATSNVRKPMNDLTPDEEAALFANLDELDYKNVRI